MNRRQIREDQVRAVPAEPEVVLPVRPGRVVAQRIIAMGQPPPDPEKEYLFRVFVDVDRQPPELVTVYRTSQIRKYRSKP